VPIEELRTWDLVRHAMIPPTRALLRHFGWM
jgi:hypothetical protein